ncbi:MAG TPA: hypothetical protein VNL16_07825 [Chloroflexota bacterium]|nr:hypothetical protein [Chloroflexota bacterium]
MSIPAVSSELAGRALARLRGAGVPEERLPLLVDRAAQLLGCLEAIEELDAELPEPALTWQPIQEARR